MSRKLGKECVKVCNRLNSSPLQRSCTSPSGSAGTASCGCRPRRAWFHSAGCTKSPPAPTCLQHLYKASSPGSLGRCTLACRMWSSSDTRPLSSCYWPNQSQWWWSWNRLQGGSRAGFLVLGLGEWSPKCEDTWRHPAPSAAPAWRPVLWTSHVQ